MQSFKEYLIEGVNDFAPWQPRNEEDAKKVIVDQLKLLYKIPNWNILPGEAEFLKNGMVNYNSSFGDLKTIANVGNNQIGFIVKHKTINANIVYIDPEQNKAEITTLQGCPVKVSKDLSINSSKLSSFEYFNTDISNGTLSIDCPNLKEWGIDCKFECSSLKFKSPIDYILIQTLYQHVTIKYSLQLEYDAAMCLKNKGLLTLLKVKGDFRIQLISPSDFKNDEDILKAIKIINTHTESKNILACQEELMDNGLKEYAKL